MFLRVLPMLTLLLVGFSWAYHVDTRGARLLEPPGRAPGSYFGFAVGLCGVGNESLLLVGAPRANSTQHGALELLEPGAVYRCSTGGGDRDGMACAEWPLYRNEREIYMSDFRIEKLRNNSWLGATIEVDNSTTPRVVVCAPRWMHSLTDAHSQHEEDWFMNGMCYTTRMSGPDAFDRGASATHFPLVMSDQVIAVDGLGYYYYGMGQAGFSAHLTPGSSDFVLGAPGAYRWTGSALLLGERSLRSPYAARFPNIISQLYLSPDDYFGYSITSGHFYKQGERLYASGAPRSENLLGSVLIFAFSRYNNAKLNLKNIMEGEQRGEYFGSSLAACDINNDGRDDLIVGAPQWSKESDEGRVYAYISKGQTDFEVRRIEGRHRAARLGTSITCLGDLDFDGYADLAVGAPYEDEMRGAIYVFHGAADGLQGTERRGQRIGAAEISSSLRGFGISVAEPRDLDGDRYAELAVGAHLSGHAVLLKSRPVVTLAMQLRRADNFTLLHESSEFYVYVCCSFDGAFAPETIEILLSLKIDEIHKRVIIYQNGKLYWNIYATTITFKKGQHQCYPVKIILKKHIQNVIDPIEFVANVTSNDPDSCLNCPIINPILSTCTDVLKLAFTLDCGLDELCISNLHVRIASNLNSNESYIIGSKSIMNVSVLVENWGEPAYGAQIFIFVPRPITLARIPPDCGEHSQVNKISKIVCNIGNPLRQNKTMFMELDMDAIEYNIKFTEIQVVATTQSEENDISNNNASLVINYDIDAEVTIIGKASKDLHSYFDVEVNPNKYQVFEFSHSYEIIKFGITPIEEAVLVVNIPTHWRNNRIAQINRIEGFVDGRNYDCEHIKGEESDYSLILFQQQYFYQENNLIVIPPENRTFYVNCSNPDITCQKIQCKLGPFIKVQSIAKFCTTISFQLSNTTDKTMKGKDIIFFVTDGSVTITRPNVTNTVENKRPNYRQIASIMLRHLEFEKVAIWIIISSVLLGIVLLIISTILLSKLGFFDRRMKKKYDNLQSHNEVNENGEENIDEPSNKVIVVRELID